MPTVILQSGCFIGNDLASGSDDQIVVTYDPVVLSQMDPVFIRFDEFDF